MPTTCHSVRGQNARQRCRLDVATRRCCVLERRSPWQERTSGAHQGRARDSSRLPPPSRHTLVSRHEPEAVEAYRKLAITDRKKAADSRTAAFTRRWKRLRQHFDPALIHDDGSRTILVSDCHAKSSRNGSGQKKPLRSPSLPGRSSDPRKWRRRGRHRDNFRDNPGIGSVPVSGLLCYP